MEAPNDNCVFIESEKGKKVLIKGGYKYYYHYHRKYDSGGTNWRCSNLPECNTSITLDSKGKVTREGKHLCLPDSSKREIEKCLHACKLKVRTSMVPVQHIFEEEISKLKEEGSGCNIVAVPEFSSRKSSLYRAKYRYLGMTKGTFQNIEDVELPQCFTDNFLIYDGCAAEDKIIIFATELALSVIKEQETYYSDGTFKMTPHPFYQTYTLHANLTENSDENRFIPLVYALLPNKTEKTYKNLFTLLKEKVGMKITNFKCDFEIATINAIRGVFPEVKITGCFYHYQKAIWAKSKELELSKSEDGYMITKLCCVMAHLPPHLIPEAYLSVQEKMPNEENFQKFHNYFLNFWLQKITSDIFTCFNENVRTTNSIEGWHHRMNTKIPKRPAILLFVSLLRKESTYQDFRIRQSQLHCSAKKRKTAIVNINNQIKNIVGDCNNGKIEVLDCLDRLLKLPTQ